MKNPLALLFWMLVLGGVVNYVVISSQHTAQNREELSAAYSQYGKGETAGTLGERADAFNSALKYYTDLEARYHPSFGNGRLYFNIGNSYFHLEAFPFAVLNYYKAHSLMPRDEKVANNLKVALSKLGIEEKNKESLFSFPFSLPERLQCFFALSLGAFLFYSAFIWYRIDWLKKGASFLAFLALILLLNLGYSYYLEPIEGVVVKSTSLYRDAGMQYAKVKEEPILSGVKVEVFDVVKEGKWLKIETSAGEVGYIPQESFRMI